MDAYGNWKGYCETGQGGDRTRNDPGNGRDECGPDGAKENPIGIIRACNEGETPIDTEKRRNFVIARDEPNGL